MKFNILLITLTIFIFALVIGYFQPRFQTFPGAKTVPSPTILQVGYTYPTLLPQPSVIRLYPEKSTVISGSDFRVFVLLQTGTHLKTGAHVRVYYDPMFLQVVDTIAQEPGVQVSKFIAYDAVATRSADNTTGTIDIDLRKKDPKQAVSESGFAGIKFKTLSKGKSAIRIDPKESRIYFVPPPSSTTIYDTISVEVI